jgi:hypothetical protein
MREPSSKAFLLTSSPWRVACIRKCHCSSICLERIGRSEHTTPRRLDTSRDRTVNYEPGGMSRWGLRLELYEGEELVRIHVHLELRFRWET